MGWEYSESLDNFKTKYFFESGMGETILGEDLKDEGLPVWSSTELDKYFGYVSESKLKLNIGDLVIQEEVFQLDM